MNLRFAKAVIGLFARTDASNPLARGEVTLGQEMREIDLSGANVLYAFRVTSVAAGNVARITLINGTVAAVTGAPTISPASTKDFQGGTIETSALLRGYLVQATAPNGTVTLSCQQTAAGGTVHSTAMLTGDACQQFLRSMPIVNDVISLTFSAAGDSVLVCVMGQTSSPV